MADCARASLRLSLLVRLKKFSYRLGIVRHPRKGLGLFDFLGESWNVFGYGMDKIVRDGVQDKLDARNVKEVTGNFQRAARPIKHAAQFLWNLQFECRSLSLFVPLARFYTRSLYKNLSSGESGRYNSNFEAKGAECDRRGGLSLPSR